MKLASLLSLLLVVPFLAFSQSEQKPTNAFTISGDVKASKTVTIEELKKMKAISIGDVVITNHLGEKRSEAKGMKGVLLKDVLGLVEINAESPRVLSEYYFTCTANDDYRVVYSWNELFNTAVGETAFIVTEREGLSIDTLPDAILMVSSKDLRTGRRHVKALQTIVVNRAR